MTLILLLTYISSESCYFTPPLLHTSWVLVTHTIVDLHSDGKPRQSLQAGEGVIYLCTGLDQRIDVVLCECLVVLTVVDGVMIVLESIYILYFI